MLFVFMSLQFAPFGRSVAYACIWVALWIRQQLHDMCGTDDIDVYKLSTFLRKGWAAGDMIAGSLQMRAKKGYV